MDFLDPKESAGKSRARDPAHLFQASSGAEFGGIQVLGSLKIYACGCSKFKTQGYAGVRLLLPFHFGPIFEPQPCVYKGNMQPTPGLIH